MYESKKKCNMCNGYEKEKKDHFKVDLMKDCDR